MAALSRHRSITLVMSDDLGEHEDGTPKNVLVDHATATLFVRRGASLDQQREATVKDLLTLIYPTLRGRALTTAAQRVLTLRPATPAAILTAISDDAPPSPRQQPVPIPTQRFSSPMLL